MYVRQGNTPAAQGRRDLSETMGTGRLEAFSDGVIAIIITIMVLELKVPHGSDPALLIGIWPVLLSYALSFLMIAIYWVNHHNLLHQSKRATTAVLWCNMFWLFCLSLIPFATGYMGENRFAPFSTSLYAAVLLLTGIAYVPLRVTIAAQSKADAAYDVIWTRSARKNYLSLALYAAAVPLAFVHPALSLVLAFAVAAIYFIPNAWLARSAD
jgi:uncharacterized membrane protein